MKRNQIKCLEKLVAMVMAISICMLLPINVFAKDITPQFMVNNSLLEIDKNMGTPYISEAGRVMMPVRACLNAIGCQVDWNQEEKTVILTKADMTIKVPVGKAEIYINTHKVEIDSCAELKNGRTYLPIRAVMENFGYAVEWDSKTKTVYAHELTAKNINGGSTGIFSRKQLDFDGFTGIEGDITLPFVKIVEKGDCPYVYFGFDFANDVGNVEGGFQFIEDTGHAGYGKWTTFMRQGITWLSGSNGYMEQGSRHHLKMYVQPKENGPVDIVIELDDKEVIRKPSSISDFEKASAKVVVSMAMSKIFDGNNCFSESRGAKIENLKICKIADAQYTNFEQQELYRRWNSNEHVGGMSFGTADCTFDYVHYGEDASISIYKTR